MLAVNTHRGMDGSNDCSIARSSGSGPMCSCRGECEYSRYSSSSSGSSGCPPAACLEARAPLYSSYAYPSFICSRSAQKDSIFRSHVGHLPVVLVQAVVAVEEDHRGFSTRHRVAGHGCRATGSPAGDSGGGRGVCADSWREMGSARSTTPGSFTVARWTVARTNVWCRTERPRRLQSCQKVRL